MAIPGRPPGGIPYIPPPVTTPAPGTPGAPAVPIPAGRGQSLYTKENPYVAPKTFGEYVRRYGGSYANATPTFPPVAGTPAVPGAPVAGGLLEQLRSLFAGTRPNWGAGGGAGRGVPAPVAAAVVPAVNPAPSYTAPPVVDAGLGGEYPMLSGLISKQGINAIKPPPNLTLEQPRLMSLLQQLTNPTV